MVDDADWYRAAAGGNRGMGWGGGGSTLYPLRGRLISGVSRICRRGGVLASQLAGAAAAMTGERRAVW